MRKRYENMMDALIGASDDFFTVDSLKMGKNGVYVSGWGKREEIMPRIKFPKRITSANERRRMFLSALNTDKSKKP